MAWVCLGVLIFPRGLQLRPNKWWIWSGRDSGVLDLDYYETIYKLAHKTHDGSTSETAENFNNFGQVQDSMLQASYGSGVDKCPLTIVFLDPRMGDPHYERGQSVWFALESAAHALPEACVLLLTSDCLFEFDDQVLHRVRQNIYDKSLPLFRRMIRSGRVRLKIVDWYSYKLKSCSDFSNLSAMLMNVNFWRTEFLDDVDSDLTLILQDDATLCGSTTDSDTHKQTFMESLLKMYKPFAYVGAPWPPIANKLIPFPAEGMCLGMAIRWKTWLLPQRQWKRVTERGTEQKKNVPKPDVILPDFPPVCQDGHGPVGNGGLSLRSRQWMIRAIETCPHTIYSGLDTNSETHHYACKVMDDVNEDLYFSVVLTGMGAPMPPAVEAATFAVESLWPEDALELYDSTSTSMDTLSSRPVFQYSGRWYTAPFGIHKAFWYHPNELLRSDTLREVCPFFQFVFEPSMSRWREIDDGRSPDVNAKWIGVGK